MNEELKLINQIIKYKKLAFSKEMLYWKLMKKKSETQPILENKTCQEPVLTPEPESIPEPEIKPEPEPEQVAETEVKEKKNTKKDLFIFVDRTVRKD